MINPDAFYDEIMQGIDKRITTLEKEVQELKKGRKLDFTLALVAVFIGSAIAEVVLRIF